MALWPFKKKAIGSLSPVTDQRAGFWYFLQEFMLGNFQKDIKVDLECVLAYWAVYACIRLRASDIGKMRLKLVQQDDNGIWSEIDTGAPWLPVLRKPNRYQTRNKFFEYWVTSKLIHGNTYVLKQRDARGIVTGLYILDACAVTPLVAPNGDVYYNLRRDFINQLNLEKDVTVPASEIIHDTAICLHHPLVGVSPLYACGVAATQGLAIQNNSAHFFQNASLPGGIVMVPGAMDQAKADELKKRWKENYTGKNRGNVAVLADKMEYKPLTMNASDSQLVEQLKMTAEMVCSTFGVPAYKVGVGAMPAYNNIAALDQQYYSQCAQADIENIETLLDEGLGLTSVVGKTYGTEFDITALIRMDPTAQMAFVEQGVKASVFAPNDGRKMFDLQPAKGGESPMAQQQNYSLAALAKRDALPNPFVIDRPTPTPTPSAAGPPENADPPPTPAKALELEHEDAGEFMKHLLAGVAAELESVAA